MDVSRILSVEGCSVHLGSKRSQEVLEELAGLIKNSPAASELTSGQIVEGLRLREELGSTGFGDGVAIPHCKLPGMKDFVLALGISPAGIAFHSMDKRSVHIFCCIVGPEDDTEGHLRLLAASARVLSLGRARYELIRSETPFALREVFLYHTAPVTSLDESSPGRTQKLLTIIVQEEKTYSEIMELFLELGIVGAVTTEASMMGPVLSSVPIFAGFMDVLGRSRPEPRTVCVLVPEDSLDAIVTSIEEITGDLDTHRGACIIVTSPDMVRGNMETI